MTLKQPKAQMLFHLSLVPRTFPPPVVDRLQYTNTYCKRSNTGCGNGLGTRLVPSWGFVLPRQRRGTSHYHLCPIIVLLVFKVLVAKQQTTIRFVDTATCTATSRMTINGQITQTFTTLSIHVRYWNKHIFLSAVLLSLQLTG